MRIHEGQIHALFAYDVGFEIRLAQVPLLFGNQTIETHRFPFLTKALNRKNQPVRIRLNPVTGSNRGQTFEMRMHVNFFEVGALSIKYSYPLADVDLAEAVLTYNLLQNSVELAPSLDNGQMPSLPRPSPP